MRLQPPTGPWLAKPAFAREIFDPTRHGFPRPPSAQASSMELLLSELDESEIGWSVIAGRQARQPLGVITNDEVAAVLREYPDRFIGFACVDVNGTSHAAVSEIDRCLAMPGFKGVTIEPALARLPMYLDDSRLAPIYEHCSNRNVPLQITMNTALTSGVANPVEFASPLGLYKPARAFPKLDFIVAHGGWPSVQEVLGLAFAMPNIYVSPDLYMVGRNMPFAAEYVKAANHFLSDRMLFGTGYPSRPHRESIAAFKEWTFDHGVREKVMSSNARRLLKLPDR